MGFCPAVMTRIAVVLWTAILAACSSTSPTFSTHSTEKRTVEEVLSYQESRAESRLVSYFLGAGVHYPPRRLALLGFKSERRLEVWADDGRGWAHVTDYRVHGASGGPGPKLREGDRQVPEGLYQITYLNPNSCCHLSLKVSYPNAFDLFHAQREGRTSPGGDIFIHGGAGSSGCLAVGNPAVEELFVLVARTGMDNVEVVIAPQDFREEPVVIPWGAPDWTPELYRQIWSALGRFPAT